MVESSGQGGDRGHVSGDGRSCPKSGVHGEDWCSMIQCNILLIHGPFITRVLMIAYRLLALYGRLNIINTYTIINM